MIYKSKINPFYSYNSIIKYLNCTRKILYGVWRDKSKIKSDWSKEIADALSRQDIILILWSEDSS